MTGPHHRPWQPLALQGLVVSISAPGGQSLLECDLDWGSARRVINSEYAGENLFDRLGPAEDANDLRALADRTNLAVLEAIGWVTQIAPEDRPIGPGRGLILSAFAYPSGGSRFSTGQWGVFYAASDEITAIAETKYHRERMLAGSGPTDLEMAVLEAHVAGVCVDVRPPHPAPPGAYDPDPSNYALSQMFGRALHQARAEGLAYASVRRPTGECVAVFRPAIVHACRPIHLRTYHWDGRGINVT